VGQKLGVEPSVNESEVINAIGSLVKQRYAFVNENINRQEVETVIRTLGYTPSNKPTKMLETI